MPVTKSLLYAAMVKRHGGYSLAAALALAAALGLVPLSVAPAAAVKVRDLPTQYRQWLEEVDILMTKPERKAFLQLEKDYQRDAFIERFWAARDPIPETRINEFRDRYEVRLEEAVEQFRTLEDDRSRMFLLNGEPSAKMETDCGFYTWPLEVWTYRYSERANRSVEAVFYQPNGGGTFRLWSPSEGHAALLPQLSGALANEKQRLAFHQLVLDQCAEIWDDTLAMLETFRRIEFESGAGSQEASSPPVSSDPEWVAGFHAFSTEVAADVEPLVAELNVAFLGPHQSRTRVGAVFSVARDAAGLAGEGGEASYNFQLTGEVLVDDELFESFRYRYDLPEGRVLSDRLALHFERALRPGDYRWVLKLEDLNGGTVLREEREVEVPRMAADATATASAPEDLEDLDLGGAPSITLGEPSDDVVSGALRFTASVAGEGVAKVRFLLDGREMLTKTRPPYGVDLKLGSVPRTHTVRAVALAADGSELATDETLINPGRHSFVVRVVEPLEGAEVSGLVRARAEVATPEGERVERLEFFVGEDRVAVLFQEPYVQQVEFPSSELGYLRAVAHLESGGEAEDLIVVNSPQFGAEVEVRLVELYASVLDGAGSAVVDLDGEAFTVTENGERQELLRFEYLKNLPLFAGLLIDTSASMAEHFQAVHAIGSAFLEETIGPRDRAAVVAFSEEPRLAAPFTNDLQTLSSALGGLRAQSGTALWDSLVYTIDYFAGIKGQRALIVLSDGEDRRSRQTFDDALQFAQNTGITIYPVALDSQLGRQGRRRLAQLAEQTGGRSYFIDGVERLAEVYGEIQRDLRSRYLLTYQSTLGGPEGFRAIDVRVAGGDFETRTLKGYFP